MTKANLMTHNKKIGAREVTLKELEAMPAPSPIGPREKETLRRIDEHIARLGGKEG